MSFIILEYMCKLILLVCFVGIIAEPTRAQLQFIREPPFILYTVFQKEIKVINLDGSNPAILYAGNCPNYLDYDIRRGFVYWQEECDGGIPNKIWSLDVRTDRAEPVAIHEARTEPGTNGLLERFRGLALDWVNNRLYYSDLIEDEIEVYDLNNNTFWTVVSGGGLATPRKITVDPINNWMYWLDHGASRIERAHLDGTGREVIASGGFNDAYSITIDIPNQILYWTNFGSGNIETASVDGSGRTTVRGVTQRPIGISYYDGSVYYTDWRSQRVNCLSSDGVLTTLITETELSQQTRLTRGIEVVHLSRQPLPGLIDECQASLHDCDENAVCTDLDNGYTCTCNLGYIGDGTTCTKSTFSIVTLPPTGTQDQVCPSQDLRQNAMDQIRSDIRSLIGNFTIV